MTFGAKRWVLHCGLRVSSIRKTFYIFLNLSFFFKRRNIWNHDRHHKSLAHVHLSSCDLPIIFGYEVMCCYFFRLAEILWRLCEPLNLVVLQSVDYHEQSHKAGLQSEIFFFPPLPPFLWLAWSDHFFAQWLLVLGLSCFRDWILFWNLFCGLCSNFLFCCAMSCFIALCCFAAQWAALLRE